jgi:chemotaxis protein MotB
MIERRTLHTTLRRIALLGAASVLASCVTQDQYDRSTDLAKFHQDQNYQLDLENQRLREENAALKAQVQDAYTRGLQEAGYDKEAQARIDELQARIAELDRPLEDVETFRVEGGYVTMIQDSLLFDSGSADLGEAGKKALAGIATDILKNPYDKIYVRGHTDTDPIKKPATLKKFPKGNMQLSAERAVAVAALLDEQKGIKSSDLVVMGFGPHMPLKANDSAANKKMNRRVEIFVADAGN